MAAATTTTTTTKRVAIVGAGSSGLAACKHLLAKGFRPVVFEAADSVGGVWRRALASTRLQTPAAAYRFSDFPWPAGSTDAEECPRHDQVAAYLAAYARRFGVLGCVRLRSRVVAAEFVGPPEPEVAAWDRWSGNGEAFGDGTGAWRLAVKHGDSEETQMYTFDFLILCVGRYGVPKVPKFPRDGGPEAFRGKVLHSMEYSRMAYADAAELVRGKRVAVVGGGKSGMDAVAQIAEANGAKYPSTLIYRNASWMLDSEPSSWVATGFQNLTTTRLGELMVHKPGEGLALSLLATLLTPLRWLMAKLTEAYYKKHVPMRKHGMVPGHSYAQAIAGSWRIGVLPPRFYDMVDEGSIVLTRCSGGSFSFCHNGLVLDDGERRHVAADVVILATGFDEDRLLKDVFVSPWFREIIVSSGPSENTMMLPLYRQCVHPRIPQMAVVGYAESVASIYPYEMMAKWVAHLLAGEVRLPGVAAMERSVAQWERWGQQQVCRTGGFYKSCIANVTTWYHDQLCRDMGYSPRRKKGGRRLVDEWLQPYGPTDYAAVQ